MNQTTWLGHPRGLATLFFTEMFERFTYYGMRAILVFFLAASALDANAGLGLTREEAGAVYGLYTGAVYLLCLPGGWLADRLLGSRRTVFWGGVLITVGNFTLAIPAGAPLFIAGLAVISLGVGMLKPNVSAVVGSLYVDQPTARRDAGFSIFYMGINLGSFLAPLIVGTVGEGWSWRLGFALSGLFMALGVLQFRLTEHYLGEAGRPPLRSVAERSRDWRRLGVAALIALIVIGLIAGGLIPLSLSQLARLAGSAMVALAVLFFAYVLLFAGLSKPERGRVAVIAIFFVCAALFWAGFEQAATTLNLFAQDYTDRSLVGAWLPGGEHPASWYQSANPLYIILLSPFFAWLWVALGRHNLDPSAPAKFGLGLLQLGLGFAVIMFAALLIVRSGGKVGPQWLMLMYLLHTTGELCLSPVGLSNVTRLSPPRFVGQMMGTWFLGAAVGNVAAGLIGGEVGSSAAQMPWQFLQMALTGGGAGLLMLLLTARIRTLMNLPESPPSTPRARRT